MDAVREGRAALATACRCLCSSGFSRARASGCSPGR